MFFLVEYDIIEESLCIVHTGAAHSWVCISTIECGDTEVDVFDSIGPGLTGALVRQIVSILCTKQDEINITYVTSDCFVCLHLILLLLQVQAVSTSQVS